MSKTILFLHGAGLSSRMWHPVIEHLSDFTCLVPDLPEHGQHPLAGTLTLDNTIAQLLAWLGARATDSVHLVGLSLGGAIGVSLAARHPTLVKSLLISGTATRLHPFLARLQNLNAPIVRWLPSAWTARLMAQQFNIPANFLSSVQADLQRLTPEAIIRTSTLLSDIAPPDQIRVPTLVLVGAHETFVVRRMANTYLQAIPDVVGYVVPDVGHVWTYQNPALFAATVRAWITSSPLPVELKPL